MDGKLYSFTAFHDCLITTKILTEIWTKFDSRELKNQHNGVKNYMPTKPDSQFGPPGSTFLPCLTLRSKNQIVTC
jgi:hypothetical protein